MNNSKDRYTDQNWFNPETTLEANCKRIRNSRLKSEAACIVCGLNNQLTFFKKANNTGQYVNKKSVLMQEMVKADKEIPPEFTKEFILETYQESAKMSFQTNRIFSRVNGSVGSALGYSVGYLLGGALGSHLSEETVNVFGYTIYADGIKKNPDPEDLKVTGCTKTQVMQVTGQAIGSLGQSFGESIGSNIGRFFDGLTQNIMNSTVSFYRQGKKLKTASTDAFNTLNSRSL